MVIEVISINITEQQQQHLFTNNTRSRKKGNLNHHLVVSLYYYIFFYYLFFYLINLYVVCGVLLRRPEFYSQHPYQQKKVVYYRLPQGGHKTLVQKHTSATFNTLESEALLSQRRVR